MRIVYRASDNSIRSIRKGYIDEVEFDMASKQGTIRGSDGISLMVKAKLREGLALAFTYAPFSLRARAVWVLQQAGVRSIVVEPTPEGEVDPPVGPLLDSQASAWQQIATAAYDALHGAWIDRDGVLRFRHFANPDTSSEHLLVLGGVTGLSMAVETLGTLLSLEGVYNHVIGYSDMPLNAPVEVEVRDEQSIQVYGDMLLRRERGNPDVSRWAYNVLADRGSLTNQHVVGTIRPQSEVSLETLLNAGMATRVVLRVDNPAHGPGIYEFALALGGSLEANVDTGWSATLITYQPGGALQAQSRFKVVRYTCNLNQEIISKQGGQTSYVNHLAEMNVMSSAMTDGAHEIHQVLLNFPPIDWTGITQVHHARLRLFRPFHEDEAGSDIQDGG